MGPDSRLKPMGVIDDSRRLQQMLTVVVITVVLIAFILVLAGWSSTTGKPSASRKDITESLVLTSQDEEWLLAGRELWYDDIERKWNALLAKAERYETSSDKSRLRIKGLGPDPAALHVLERMAYCASQAAEKRLAEEWQCRQSQDADPFDYESYPQYERALERIEQRKDRFDEKVYEIQNRYDAKHHWWFEMDAEERREDRRTGRSWHDYLN